MRLGERSVQDDQLKELQLKRDSITSIATIVPLTGGHRNLAKRNSSLKRKESTVTITTLPKTYIDDDVVFFSPTPNLEYQGNHGNAEGISYHSNDGISYHSNEGISYHSNEGISRNSCSSVISFNIPCQHNYYREHRWMRDGRKHLEFHTPNSRTPPNMAQISIALEFIEDTFDSGGKTFIRSYSKACRSAVLMACYLMSNHGYSVRQAMGNLKEIQPKLSFSELQFDCLKNFSRMLLRDEDEEDGSY